MSAERDFTEYTKSLFDMLVNGRLKGGPLGQDLMLVSGTFNGREVAFIALATTTDAGEPVDVSPIGILFTPDDLDHFREEIQGPDGEDLVQDKFLAPS